jgi:hypothetical protein
MTLFELLSMDERVIVYSDVGAKVIYTWNRSLTLQAWKQRTRDWTQDGPGYWGNEPIDGWEEVEVQTLSDEPKTYEKAREAAIRWSNS